ncbi:hypothetical protein B0H16DRAFT_389091 [Mycena metata]|uniref:Uncharacterized protein n=1 Tax=Mycena metata TaxID=1033252 RepID=A0AAD7HHN1_9AGAR|nr:hypothetical protein B0H16DRAFT_389091 [Mycena metata]
MESTLGTLTVPGLGLDRIDAAVEAGGAQSDLATALGACLDRVKVVVEMVDQLAQVHPYVSAAWRILTAVYKAVEQQREMDDKVVELIKTMVEVYSFTEDINFVVEKIKILEDTLIKIAKQTLECAKFLEEYRQHGFSGRAFQTVFLNKHGKRIEELSTDLVKLREAFDHALSTQILSHTTRLGKL